MTIANRDPITKKRSAIAHALDIGELFKSQRALEECLSIDKYLLLNENVADFDLLRIFKDSLRAPRIIDQFRRKRSVKK